MCSGFHLIAERLHLIATKRRWCLAVPTFTCCAACVSCVKKWTRISIIYGIICYILFRLPLLRRAVVLKVANHIRDTTNYQNGWNAYSSNFGWRLPASRNCKDEYHLWKHLLFCGWIAASGAPRSIKLYEMRIAVIPGVHRSFTICFNGWIGWMRNVRVLYLLHLIMLKNITFVIKNWCWR